MKLLVVVIVLLSSVVAGVGVGQEPPQDELLNSFLQVVVALAVPVLLGYLGVLARVLYLFVRSKLSKEQNAFLDDLARRYVMAAEQYGLTKKLEQAGQEKKRIVIDKLAAAALAKGYRVDVQTLSDITEAAVYDEINRWKQDPPRLPGEVTHDNASS